MPMTLEHGQEAFAAGLRGRLGLPDAVALHGLRFDAASTFATLVHGLPERLRTVSAKRRREFLAGRLCAAEALSRAGYAGPGWLGQDAAGLPAWPKGWSGSISHSRTAALAAACPCAMGVWLGLDIEEMGAPRDIAEIASLIAQPGELAALAALPDALAVILLFSAKESLYKALYPRLRTFRHFSAARLVAAGNDRLTLRLEEDWGALWPAGRQVEVRHALHGDHVVTVLHCVR